MRDILKKNSNRCCFTWIVLLLLLGIGYPQVAAQEAGKNANITGKVVDQFGNPVSEVIVTMKKSDFKAVTGSDGIFEFQYEKGEVLCLSHPGFLNKQIKVNKLKNTERVFKVTLAEEYVKLPQVINGPYDIKDRNSFLGSAATVYTDQVSSMLSTTIIPSLQGRLPGLNISQLRGARIHQTANISSGAIMGNVPADGVMGKGAYGDNTEFSISSRHNSPIVMGFVFN